MVAPQLRFARGWLAEALSERGEATCEIASKIEISRLSVASHAAVLRASRKSEVHRIQWPTEPWRKMADHGNAFSR
jgi:hypothetical protein